MRLVRFGPRNEERPGVWLEGARDGGRPGILDVRAMAFDIEDYNEHFFRTDGLDRLRALLQEPRLNIVSADGVRLGPPVARPGAIMCMGKNYAEHAKEFGSEAPTSPVVFAKAGSSLQGAFDPIVLSPACQCVDGEAELAVVLGRVARRLTEAEAMDVVAGYTILNDVTDRVAQRAGQQWFYGKSFDTFCPLGPFLVTADEIPDPHALRVFSRLNGTVLQDGNTADMIFRIPAILAHLSAGMTLHPGDIVATGTPSGIGSAHKPPRLLQPGDQLETGVEKLGLQVCGVARG